MATVAGLTGVSRILGFIRDVLTAAILGVGPIADAFFVALKLPNFFRRITAEGAFSVAFIPLYAEKLEKEGEEQASFFASNILSVMLAVMAPFTAFAVIAMPVIIYLIAPGFGGDAERFDTAVALGKITFPYLLFMSLTALLGGLLNAHQKYAPFASAPIFFNLCLIIGLLGLQPHVPTAGHALAYGIALAGLVQFLWLVFHIKKYRVKIAVSLPKFGEAKKLFKLMVPGVIGAGVIHINLFADVIIASTLASGSISYLYYADRLNQLPLGMIGIAVGTVLLPVLSRAIAAGNKEETTNLFTRAIEVSLLMSLPAAAALMVMPDTIISTLFERGEFTAADTQQTINVLMGYAIGIPAYVAGKVYATAYWSQQDTMSPVKVSIITTISNIILSLILIWPLGVAGIAISTGVMGWLQLFLLRRGLRGHETLKLDSKFRTALAKMLFATLMMTGIVMVMDINIKAMGFETEIAHIMSLIGLVALGLIVYGAAVITTGAIKFVEFKKFFSKDKPKDV